MVANRGTWPLKLPLKWLINQPDIDNVCFFEKYSGYLETNAEVPLKNP